MIPLTKPFFDEAEVEAVREVLSSGWVAGQGPKGDELAEKVAHLLGVKFAVPVVNCTAGLHLALLAIGIGPGDEVLVSDFTFPATGHAVMYCGAKPRFVDVNRDTYNCDLASIESLITKKTKAIVVVHAFGQMADMEAICEVADKHELIVIEDAACAMGALRNGRPAGSWGEISAFSFHARKNVTGGEGGIVVTNSDLHFEKVRALSCFGMESALNREKVFSIPRFTELGYNYKLSDINCAVVLTQLEKLPRMVEERRTKAARYDQLLARTEQVHVPIVEPGNFHIYQTYCVMIDDGIDRNRLIVDLRNDGVQVQIGTYSSHMQPVYASTDSCPNSRTIFEHSLALPLYYGLTDELQDEVVDKLQHHIQRQA